MSDMCMAVYPDGTSETRKVDASESIWDVFPGASMVIIGGEQDTFEDVAAMASEGGDPFEDC